MSDGRSDMQRMSRIQFSNGAHQWSMAEPEAAGFVGDVRDNVTDAKFHRYFGIVPQGMALTSLALRWILMFEAVSCAIPGARRPAQVAANVLAADLPSLSPQVMAAVRDLYERRVRRHVHHFW
jgi:aryl-alcohol dehydrogenase-like predicted oxidoreductase